MQHREYHFMQQKQEENKLAASSRGKQTRWQKGTTLQTSIVGNNANTRGNQIVTTITCNKTLRLSASLRVLRSRLLYKHPWSPIRRMTTDLKVHVLVKHRRRNIFKQTSITSNPSPSLVPLMKQSTNPTSRKRTTKGREWLFRNGNYWTNTEAPKNKILPTQKEPEKYERASVMKPTMQDAKNLRLRPMLRSWHNSHHCLSFIEIHQCSHISGNEHTKNTRNPSRKTDDINTSGPTTNAVHTDRDRSRNSRYRCQSWSVSICKMRATQRKVKAHTDTPPLTYCISCGWWSKTVHDK